jgi:hypothetical protein
MKNLILISFFALSVVACKNFFSNKNDAIPVDLHEVVAKEMINTSSYTYVRIAEFDKEQWVAIPKTEIKLGNTYFYQGGMVMDNFRSTELNRTFDSVLFLEGLSEDRDHLITKSVSGTMGKRTNEEHVNVNAVSQTKKEIALKHIDGVVPISELYKNKSTYAEKKVRVSGIVIKFSPEIMKKNWIHLQDGTESEGKFDLTITTNATAQVGDTVLFEGNIILDKDFGYGYNYEILLEDAVLLKGHK